MMTKHGAVWLRGPVPSIEPLLQPVAHALLQVAEDLTGSLDRLFTYARGESLNATQLRTTRADALLETREVGRAKLPSNTLGLLFHAAEHSTRHAGQIVTLRRVVEGYAASP